MNARPHSVGQKQDARLAELLLDSENPRFGGLGGAERDQASVLEHIVDTFGVDDLLSSLAVNGYFEAEPIVVRKTDAGLVVAEGNRRLAACLMLTGDPRARRVEEKAALYRKDWIDHRQPALDPIPVIVFEGDSAKRELLSYLGVRHISASKSWDSYAKAAWVAEVVEQHDLSVKDIATMIGDQHRTIDRLLQGYYVVQQLVRTGEFRPSDSLRTGRGSVTEYPFSWVYTVIGYEAARRYLGLEAGPATAEPIPAENVRKGGTLMRAMFGDKKIGRNPSVVDSRQLGRLASLLVNPETLTLVERGESVEAIEAAIQPINDKLRIGIEVVRETLRDMIARLEEVELDKDVASGLVKPAEKASSLAAALYRRLQEVALG